MESTYSPNSGQPNHKFQRGFTMVEVVVAIGGMAVLATLAVSFLFSVFTQRDQAIAEIEAIEQSQVVFPMVGTAVRKAENISIANGGKRLEVERSGECFTFEWDEVSEEMKYGRSEAVDCVAPITTDQNLTSAGVNIERVKFSMIEATDSARTVMMEMDVGVYRPLWSGVQNYSQVFVNVMDAEWEEEI